MKARFLKQISQTLLFLIFSLFTYSVLEAQATCNTAIDVNIDDGWTTLPIDGNYRWYCIRLTTAGAFTICLEPGTQASFFETCQGGQFFPQFIGGCGEVENWYGYCPEDDRVYIRIRKQPEADFVDTQEGNQLNQAYVRVLPGQCEIDPCDAPRETLTCDRIENGTTVGGRSYVFSSAYEECREYESDYAGNDVVYELNSSAIGQPVTVTLNRFGNDMDLFIYDCSSGRKRCVDHSDNVDKQIESIYVESWDRDYLIIVDAYSSAIASRFSLVASCVDPCSDADNLRCNQQQVGFTGALS